MRWLKQCFAFYVFGNIHVGLAVYALTKITFLQYGIRNQALANFVFFATVLSYNFIRLFQVGQVNNMVTLWFRANKSPLWILNFLAAAGCLYYASFFKMQDFKVLIPLMLATVLYVFPFKRKIMGLRFVPGLKLILISATWAGVTLFLPLYMGSVWESNGTLLHFLQRMLFVFAITIPFDIRDVQIDEREMATLPQLVGIGAAKFMALIALLLYMVLDLVLGVRGTLYFWPDLFIMLLSALMIVFSQMNSRRYYTAFWVEAIPIGWYLLYLLVVYQGIF